MELPDKISAYIAEKRHRQRPPAGGHHQQDPGLQGSAGQRHRRRNRHPGHQDMLRRSNEYVPTPEAILEYISKYYSLDESVIRGQQRVRDAVSARQIAMYLIRSMTNLSLDEIGKVFDNRDHSTVLYSIQQIEKKMKKDAAFCRNGEGDQDEYQLQAVTRFLHIFRGKEKLPCGKWSFKKSVEKSPDPSTSPVEPQNPTAQAFPRLFHIFFPTAAFSKKYFFLFKKRFRPISSNPDRGSACMKFSCEKALLQKRHRRHQPSRGPEELHSRAGRAVAPRGQPADHFRLQPADRHPYEGSPPM